MPSLKPSLRSILRDVGKELRRGEGLREKVQEGARKTTNFSKQAILLIHQKRPNEARKTLEKAGEIVSRLNKLLTEHPEITYGGQLSEALQEYSEASILLALIEESRFVGPKEIGVPPTDYVLGLADVVGECRRLTLDALREGDVEASERYLRIMDEIYAGLMAMGETYMLIPGLRRKCDVARKVIEATRGDVTQEVRRQSLEKSLKRFEKLAKGRIKG